MFGKGSKLYSIFKMKCPRCHEGDLFKTKNAYDLKNIANMNERCPVCDQNYHPEPNFYYGSMYISYGYTVALFVAAFIIGEGFFDVGIWKTVGALSIVLVLLSPFLFRLSRSTYINLFVKFNKDYLKEKAGKNV